MTRVSTLALLMTIFLVGAISSVMAADRTPRTPATIRIEAPDQIDAGSSVHIVVTADQVTDGEIANLILIGGYGSSVHSAAFSSGGADFDIDGEESRIAGVVTIAVTVEGAHVERPMTILPGEAIEPVKPLIGARSIVADGEHWSMVVAIPFDQFGNPVADGTEVQIRTLHPGAVKDDQTIEVTNLVAWRKVYSGTKAGRTTVATQVGEAYGPEGVIEEVAGWPTTFEITASRDAIPADGQDQVDLRTSVIADRYGNVLPDGTLVTFVATGPKGETRIPAVTIGGVATAPLRAPADESTLQVRAIVFDIESNRIEVSFGAGPAVGSFPVTATIVAGDGELSITAGPIIGAMGAFVPDGTEVTFDISNGKTSVKMYGNVSAGHASATVRLAELQAGTYRIDVFAGSGSGTTTVQVPAIAEATPTNDDGAGTPVPLLPTATQSSEA